MIEPEDVNESAQYFSDDECAEFQALMSVRIGEGEDLQSYDHMKTCERCRALLGELEFIADLAAELMKLQMDPKKDLWSGIKDAISRDESNGFHAASEDVGEDPLAPAIN